MKKNEINARKLQNISYFCIVKRFRTYFRAIALCFLCSLTTSLSAQEADSTLLIKMDSVDISLLTCGPGKKIYTLYGHTAIRINDRVNNEDWVANWGIFSFNQPFFVPRFVFGLTDYHMGVSSTEDFRELYVEDENRWLVEQRLNLTRKEKAQILRALAVNYQPENRTYRYNYFYDDCTTRARDMILNNIDGIVGYPGTTESNPSCREYIHQWNSNHRWARFGNDLLLGLKADNETSIAVRQFLPENLRNDFSIAVVRSADGTSRKLVAEEQKTDAAVKTTEVAPSPFTTPTACFLVLAGIILLVTIAEYIKKRNFWLLDVLLLLADGLAGLILFVMVFSQHPTVSLNLQILLLNPLSLVFLYPAVSKSKRGELHWFWIAFACCILLFLAGNLLQHYAEGMNILALSLLVRCWGNIETKSLRRKKK